jgi:hypothetical protein
MSGPGGESKRSEKREREKLKNNKGKKNSTPLHQLESFLLWSSLSL